MSVRFDYPATPDNMNEGKEMIAMPFKRICLIVMDSVGVGEEPDAERFGDTGSNTFTHASYARADFSIPTLESLGIGELDDINGTSSELSHPHSYALRLREASNGKDTMTGHWEMMGIDTEKPFKTFTDTGFPQELIDELSAKTGHKILGNVAASGTEIIKELGEQAMRENALIVYTSADSVLQIAAHEEKLGLDELYRACEIAREMCMRPEWRVGRVIARPFVGNDAASFKRTSNRHDYALKPPLPTDLDALMERGYRTDGIGKIGDIFDMAGISSSIHTKSNEDGMDQTIDAMKKGFEGLLFVNLVEFDSEYGHRRNPKGYADCIMAFDRRLAELLPLVGKDDLLLITADHGNDPTFHGTDHTREKVPLIAYSPRYQKGRYLEERASFADIGATILANFSIPRPDHLIGKPIPELLDDGE